MAYTSTRHYRGMHLSVAWNDGRWIVNVACSSLSGPDHGTWHISCHLTGHEGSIPSVEDLLATATAALEKIKRDRGRPEGRPLRAGLEVDRWHTAGIPSGDHRGGRARWER